MFTLVIIVISITCLPDKRLVCAEELPHPEVPAGVVPGLEDEPAEPHVAVPGLDPKLKKSEGIRKKLV